MKKLIYLALTLLTVACTSDNTPDVPQTNDGSKLPNGMYLTYLVDTYDETVMHNISYNDNGTVSKIVTTDSIYKLYVEVDYSYNPFNITYSKAYNDNIKMNIQQNSNGFISKLSFTIDNNTRSYEMKYNGDKLIEISHLEGEYAETISLTWDNGNIIRVMCIESDMGSWCEEYEYSAQENKYNQFTYPIRNVIGWDFENGLLGAFLNGQLGVSTKNLPSKVTFYEIGYEQYTDVENIEYQLDSDGVILSEFADGERILQYQYSTIK